MTAQQNSEKALTAVGDPVAVNAKLQGLAGIVRETLPDMEYPVLTGNGRKKRVCDCHMAKIHMSTLLRKQFTLLL